jgi:cysteine desulfuration protein SufE
MNLAERQKLIVTEFQKLENWEDRYKKIIELGKALPNLTDDLKTEDAKVKGCQSQVWLHASRDENKLLQFKGDSDALLVKGLVALVLQVYSGSTSEEILKSEPSFLNDLGLSQNLTPSRANGVAAMVRQIKFYAFAYSLK